MPRESFEQAPDQHRQQTWQEQVAELQVAELTDVPLDELVATFDPADIQQLDAYQQPGDETSVIDRMVEQPFSAEFLGRYNRATYAGKLACNTALYDDDLEDVISNDRVVQMLMDRIRRTSIGYDRKPEDFAHALRIRRSVVAIIASQRANATVQPLPKNIVPTDSPDSTAA